MKSHPWKAIAAMSENRVIGNRGQIPWHLPEDFKWVKACTEGQVIAMGRKTFESMGRPLPKRENIVISRSAEEIPGCTVLPSLDALEAYTTDREIWIFGGAQIYAQAFDRIGELYLTIVKGSFEGDTFFPPFEDQFDLAETVREEPAFKILKYVHKANGK
ncbi:dihydrofolate reductase [Puniceicoccales bacterium CK1056]|uniref:Dihydrofolate reductase n=1 Tax=Oceanipulchritudo coccoides TaxID=2706888 RepID=A0A6B2M2S6_9BACT|nr:dihydrofolate reductase [Oceanipulchritudo coccoides]NDV62387.1 dihydrofolate reductase [Oceanipulchritudo coccoides]